MGGDGLKEEGNAEKKRKIDGDELGRVGPVI